MNKYRDNPQSMFYEHTYPEDRLCMNSYYEGMRDIANEQYYKYIQARRLANQYTAEEIAEQRKDYAIHAIKSQPYFKDKP